MATITGIKEIRYLCDEAIDHGTGWQSFRTMIEHRLEIEGAFVGIASSANTKDQVTPAPGSAARRPL